MTKLPQASPTDLIMRGSSRSGSTMFVSETRYSGMCASLTCSQNSQNLSHLRLGSEEHLKPLNH
jgi:hypothetical protein